MPNAFITVYMTRGQKMVRHPVHDYPADFTVLQRLAESVAPYGELIVATDSLTKSDIPWRLRKTVTIFPLDPFDGNYFLQRWDGVRDVLRARTDLDYVYAVDGRDVVVVRDPWEFMEPGTLYPCTEPATLPGLKRWRGQPLGRSGFINERSYHDSPVLKAWIRANSQRIALNAGVVGGDRATMLAMATRMAECRHHDHMANDYTDMALFQVLAYEHRVVASEEFIGAKCHLEADAPNARVLHVP